MKIIGMFPYWNSETTKAAGLAYLAERERQARAVALEAQSRKVIDINNRLGSFKNSARRLEQGTARLRDMTIDYNGVVKTRDKWARERDRLMRGQIAAMRKAGWGK